MGFQRIKRATLQMRIKHTEDKCYISVIDKDQNMSVITKNSKARKQIILCVLR